MNPRHEKGRGFIETSRAPGAQQGQAAEVLLDEEDPAEGEDPVDEEPDEPADVLLLSEDDLASEPLLFLAAGAVLDDELRLSVR
jgi:hypothetical protein